MWLFIPSHLRVAFLCAVSLVWQVALSTLSNRPSPSNMGAAAHTTTPASPPLGARGDQRVSALRARQAFPLMREYEARDDPSVYD